MSELELLPCPLCGGSAVEAHWIDGRKPQYAIACRLSDAESEGYAHCRTDSYDTPEEAAAEWNARHYPPQLRICATCKWMIEDGDDEVRWLKCSHADGGADVDLDDTCAHWEMKDED